MLDKQPTDLVLRFVFRGMAEEVFSPETTLLDKPLQEQTELTVPMRDKAEPAVATPKTKGRNALAAQAATASSSSTVSSEEARYDFREP